MSAAHSIPDVLVSKITLMAYKLSPHPCAVIFMNAFVTKLKNECAGLTVKLNQLKVTNELNAMFYEQLYGPLDM